ncbi:MCP four helix bundle domain-containing protein [Foetidibacter luteolus]|uniref:MCP four helix bundle domain-containing protein n=1 Tax=Foetidibacter luteolus TaxID=2608880 RepID=UPI00129A790B|nr:MCP four helix bundle domain-containing protein [Foetidibacter luteolus]
MKWAYYVKHKVRAVLVLLVIIVAMLVSNLSHRINFTRLDDAVVAIYNDRLMPSTFIFRISEHLHQKQMLLSLPLPQQADRLVKANKLHDDAIARLIKNYEATQLTEAEKTQWRMFRNNLSLYTAAFNAEVSQRLSNNLQGSIVLAGHFDKAVENLNALSNIQVSEGKNLSRNSRSIISDGVLLSHFEVSMLLVLGVMALVLISAGTADNKMILQRHTHMMN